MKSTSNSNTRTKTAAPASRAARPVASKLPTPTEREIATRAYEIYAKSGHQPGREVEFWLEAERQLRRGAKEVARFSEAGAQAPLRTVTAGASDRKRTAAQHQARVTALEHGTTLG